MSRPAGRVAFACLLSAAAGAAAHADPAGREQARLLARVAPSIVNVKVVLKTEFDMGESTQDQESTLEARGAIVGDGGLIMLWNSQLSASRLMETVAHLDEGSDFRLKMTPTDFRVTIPGDPAEHAAFLAAADSDLDLAFLQLESPPARKLDAISFAGGRGLEVGDPVVGVSRLSPGFDRAAYLASTRVVGRLDKPRRAWILDASPDLLGLPMFDERGEAAGVVVTVFSRSGDGSAQGSDILGFLDFGGARKETGPLGVFLLPSERVAGLVREAQKRARDLLAERAADVAAEAKSPTADGASKAKSGDEE
jgi:S1-C subfamily serine protease